MLLKSLLPGVRDAMSLMFELIKQHSIVSTPQRRSIYQKSCEGTSYPYFQPSFKAKLDGFRQIIIQLQHVNLFS